MNNNETTAIARLDQPVTGTLLETAIAGRLVSYALHLDVANPSHVTEDIYGKAGNLRYITVAVTKDSADLAPLAMLTAPAIRVTISGADEDGMLTDIRLAEVEGDALDVAAILASVGVTGVHGI